MYVEFACFSQIEDRAHPDSRAEHMIDNRDTDRDRENGKRRMRLRAALRENLKRRKSQSRGRADQAASAEDTEPECRDE